MNSFLFLYCCLFSAQLEEDKTKMLKLELDISKERVLFKQLQKQIEEEKQKSLALRREDILHIEVSTISLDNFEHFRFHFFFVLFKR